MCLICKKCGYKQYDRKVIESYKAEFPASPDNMIPYICGRCIARKYGIENPFDGMTKYQIASAINELPDDDLYEVLLNLADINEQNIKDTLNLKSGYRSDFTKIKYLLDWLKIFIDEISDKYENNIR